MNAGEWCGFGAPGEAPLDQRGDDGCSLTFDSAPLRERMEILGAPMATLEVAADQPVAVIAVRLNDVAPGGAATRVTYGLLNLTHRDSHERPQPLEPNTPYLVNIRLNDIAYAFPPRHKLRLAISTGYWPIAWPAPQPITLSLFTGESLLDLPVRPPDAADSALRPYELPERAVAETTELRPAPLNRICERDRTTNEAIYTVSTGRDDSNGLKLTRIKAINLEVGHTALKRFRIGEDDPESAQAEVNQKTLFRRGAWTTRIETRTRLSSTVEDFLLEAELTAYEGDELFFSRAWSRRVKRDLI
jgi:hypothetical protein